MAVKALKCEICGGDLAKQDDMFVCEYCGTKYSVEEAKKLLVEVDGPVNVQGNVGIQKTATVVSGAGQLRYCNNCKTNINAEEAFDILGIMLMLLGICALGLFIINWILALVVVFGCMAGGIYLMMSKRYRCPFCGARGSGKPGSPISPPKLNQ